MRSDATIIAGASLVLPEGVRSGCELVVCNGLIESIDRVGTEHRGRVFDFSGCYVFPGLVDIHMHGAYGRSFNENSIEAWRAALAGHLAHGTTTALATIATADMRGLVEALSIGRDLLAAGFPGLAGLHLEGPYLNPEQRGAHGLEWLRTPSDGSWEDVRPFLPALRIVTLAPELQGATELIAALRAAGVVVSAGHSAAGVEEVREAHRAGLAHFAHLWSGQSQLTRRGPWRRLGLIEVALSSDGLSAEIIADGAHVTAELARIAYRCLGPDRLCLVSDASAGAGLPIGSHFSMGSAQGVVEATVALCIDGRSFCGSTSFLVDILRFCIRQAGFTMEDCATMASTTPARLLGLSDRVGAIRPGLEADLLVLDEELAVRAVMRGGRWVVGGDDRA